VGCALAVGPLVLTARWTPHEEAFIGQRELCLLFIAIATFSDLLAHCYWEPRTDNAPNVFAPLSGRTHEQGARPSLAALLSLEELHATRLLLRWCPREINTFMDALSKAPSDDVVHATITRFSCT
jgi:hypothetical protein